MKSFTLWQGDCLELMKNIPDGSVDMVLCDLPYGTTRNKWDSVIPLDRLWKEYKRAVKKNGAIVLFAQTPFDKILGASNLDISKWDVRKVKYKDYVFDKCPIKDEFKPNFR